MELRESLPIYNTQRSNLASLQKFATVASWVVNWSLLGIKFYATIQTHSKSVAASLADSAVDLASQAVLSWADYYITKHSPDYPVGQSRLEALSVIGCAFIMSMASIEVVQYSASDLYVGFLFGQLPELDVTYVMYLILGIGIFMKLFLWIYCSYVGKMVHSDSLGALAEDHFNDVISNSAAIISAAVAFNTTAWFVDPIGAILISLVIIFRWFSIISEQVRKIVGYTASPEHIAEVELMALNHDSRLRVDCTRMYHYGARYNVEMEIILPGNMTVRESHDIALALQHKIEGLDHVERAFVHVDHEKRDGLEHKVERELAARSTTSPYHCTTP